MAFALSLLPYQNRFTALHTMKSNNKLIASICILLFHLGLLYMAYEKIEASRQKPATQVEAPVAIP